MKVYEVLYDVPESSPMAGKSAAGDSTFIARFLNRRNAEAFAAEAQGAYGSERPDVSEVHVPSRVADRWVFRG